MLDSHYLHQHPQLNHLQYNSVQPTTNKRHPTITPTTTYHHHTQHLTPPKLTRSPSSNPTTLNIQQLQRRPGISNNTYHQQPVSDHHQLQSKNTYPFHPHQNTDCRHPNARLIDTTITSTSIFNPTTSSTIPYNILPTNDTQLPPPRPPNPYPHHTQHRTPPTSHQDTGGKYVSMIVCIMTYPPTLVPL